MAHSGSALYGVEPFATGDENIKPETIDIYELIFMYIGKKWKTSVNCFFPYGKTELF